MIVVDVDPAMRLVLVLATWGLLPILQVAHGVVRWWRNADTAEDIRVWLRGRCQCLSLRKRRTKIRTKIMVSAISATPVILVRAVMRRCVMAISEAEAIRAHPELAGLRTIRDAGWRFRPRLDESGELVGIDGWRDWSGGWRDGLGIKASTDAVAIRMFGGDLVWQCAGTLNDVVAELLVLPVPSDRTAPRLVVGTAPVLWTP